ncbi:MAG: hypothetical protein IKN87_05755 [Bacilli bacterium]|nr:hypothetical protein [Bacilli bacterium]
MEKIEEVEKILERTDDLRNIAKEISKQKGIAYEDAFAEAKNLNGVTDMSDIAEVKKYGQPSYYYADAVTTFGEEINGVPVSEISPEKLEELLTANKMGADTIEYKKGMSKDDIKKSAIENKISKEKVKKRDKILILEKPENRKDVNAA